MAVYVLILLFSLNYPKIIGFVDKNNDGVNDLFRDVNGDGINDVTGLPYPHMFGFKDDNNDGINDIFVDANGDGINDYDNSFIDRNSDGVSDNVIDADMDNRNDITGRIITRFIHRAKSVKPLPRRRQETDIFIDRGDGFNKLINKNKNGSLYDFLFRSMDGYFRSKSKHSDTVVSKKSEPKVKSLIVKSKEEAKPVKVPKKVKKTYK